MNPLEEVGRDTTNFLEYVGGVADLFAHCARFIFQLRIRMGETLSQAYTLGFQSWPIIVLTSLFTGMVISLESAEQAVQYGVGSLVGGAVSYTIVRELGPMLTAIVVASRVGAAIAAELGSMAVTEQIEALDALGLSPVQFLVVPRLLALITLLPLLTIIADVISILSGMYVASGIAHISHDSFITSMRQTIAPLDVEKGLLKTVFFAVIIVVIGAYQGMQTRGGAAGVGRATTGAVVISIILIFGANLLLSYILFGIS